MNTSFEIGRNVLMVVRHVPEGVLTRDTETGIVYDSCDLLSSLSGHVVVSSFVCALSDLRCICVTAFSWLKKKSRQSYIHYKRTTANTQTLTH